MARLPITVVSATTILLAAVACGGGNDGGGASGGSAGSGGIAGAGGDAGSGGAGGSGCSAVGPAVTLERWSAGQQAFVDATSAWQLDAIPVEGIRLAVADVDADGFADLVVRRGGVRSNDFTPGGTRAVWLLRNSGNGTFTDITQASGIVARRTDPSGDSGRPWEVIAFADIDNDGDLDAYTGLDTNDPATSLGETGELLLNDGTGSFSFGDITGAVRAAGNIDRPAGASFTDYNLDGAIDLWVTRFDQQDRLYQGDGLAGFTDVTSSTQLTTSEWRFISVINDARAHTRAWGAAACDLNGDGFPELLSPSYGRSPNHLWLARRDAGAVFYENRSIASGYAYDDNSNWQDNQFARCYCETNPAATDCSGVPPPVIVCSANWNHNTDREPYRLGGNSSSAICADIDNDGDIDLLTGEIRHWWAGSGSDGSEVLLNLGEYNVTFARPGDAALGLEIVHGASNWDEGHMTAAIFDFDNDGRLDIYQGASDYADNRGRLYHQSAQLSFTEVPITDGIDHHRSHGVVIADFDRDGDLDIIVGHSRARCDATRLANCYATSQVRFFENVFGNRNNWIQLQLIGGAGSNRAAIGARVTVTADSVTQTQEIHAGHGHYGAQDDLIVHFGIGAARTAEVTIVWPNIARDTTTFLAAAGARYRIAQDEPVTGTGLCPVP